jgi:hypothetical protein
MISTLLVFMVWQLAVIVNLVNLMRITRRPFK